MKKRILSLLLVLCLIVGLLPVVALAADAKPSVQINYYNASKAIAPGGETLYWKTISNPDNDPYNSYIMSDADDSDWNVKMEYPADGVPTITLKDATLNNQRPLHLAAATGVNPDNFGTVVASDFKVILEGTNKVTNTEPNNAYSIFFNVSPTSTVTFTGDGSLEVSSSTNSGLLRSKGNLILDEVDISLDAPVTFALRSLGIEAVGDMTVNGGSLRITGYNPYEVDESDDMWGNFRPLTHAIKVGGDLTVENGADVKVYAATNNEDSNRNPVGTLVQVAGTFTIVESDVELAILAGSKETVLGKDSAPTVDVTFAEGYTVKTSTVNGVYNPETGAFTAPTDDVTIVDDIADAILPGLMYIKISETVPCDHVPAEDDKDCSTAVNCTLCGLELTPAKTHAFTDSADTTCNNTGCEHTRTIGGSGNPNTGDISILLTAGLALASAVGMGGATILRKKNG